MADRSIYEIAAEVVADTVPWANDSQVPAEQRAAFVADIAGEEQHRAVVDAAVSETRRRVAEEIARECAIRANYYDGISEEVEGGADVALGFRRAAEIAREHREAK